MMRYRPRAVAALGMAVLLGGCSLAPFLGGSVDDYAAVHADSRDQRILLNVLRSAETLPIHFADLTNVHGVLSATGSASLTAPFGAIDGALQRRTAGLTLGASSAPTFDVNSLETQNFVTAIVSPVTPRTFKVFLDSGLDYRAAILLFVSGVRYAAADATANPTILNSPESARVVCYGPEAGPTTHPGAFYEHYTIDTEAARCPGAHEPEFFAFLRFLNQLHPVFANEFSVVETVGHVHGKVALKDAADLATNLAGGKVRLGPPDAAGATLVAVDPIPAMALCESEPDAYGLLHDSREPVCRQQEVARDQLGNPERPRTTSVGRHAELLAGLNFRSVAGMFKYLGEIIAFQRTFKRCVTLSYVGDPAGSCRRDVLFKISQPPAPDSLVVTNFDGQRWGAGTRDSCRPDAACDHTTEVMNVLSLLLGMSTSPKDLQVTPSLQLVP